MVTPAHQPLNGVVPAATRRARWWTGRPATTPPLVEPIAAGKRVSDRSSSGLDQLTVAALLEFGRYDRHLRHMRALYARRRGMLIDSLARESILARLTGLAAGFHAVAHPPEAADEQATASTARLRSAGLYGMIPQRATTAATPPQLVVGFFRDASKRTVAVLLC